LHCRRSTTHTWWCTAPRPQPARRKRWRCPALRAAQAWPTRGRAPPYAPCATTPSRCCTRTTLRQLVPNQCFVHSTRGSSSGFVMLIPNVVVSQETVCSTRHVVTGPSDCGVWAHLLPRLHPGVHGQCRVGGRRAVPHLLAPPDGGHEPGMPTIALRIRVFYLC
jgi:hypothetical protein